MKILRMFEFGKHINLILNPKINRKMARKKKDNSLRNGIIIAIITVVIGGIVTLAVNMFDYSPTQTEQTSPFDDQKNRKGATKMPR